MKRLFLLAISSILSANLLLAQDMDISSSEQRIKIQNIAMINVKKVLKDLNINPTEGKKISWIWNDNKTLTISYTGNSIELNHDDGSKEVTSIDKGTIVKDKEGNVTLTVADAVLYSDKNGSTMEIKVNLNDKDKIDSITLKFSTASAAKPNESVICYEYTITNNTKNGYVTHPDINEKGDLTIKKDNFITGSFDGFVRND